MKQALFALCTALLLLASAAGATAQNQKVTICHIPPGNPANAHEITISVNALAAHIRNHGDTDVVGPCASVTTLTCEQAVALGLLTGTITGNNATVTNNAAANFRVTLASYAMYSANVFDQTLFDVDSKIVPAGQTRTFAVDVPACMYQLDLVCGKAKAPPQYTSFQKLDSEFGSGQFCTLASSSSSNQVSASLTVDPYYPQGTSYSFGCSANGFTPTEYHWYYGDGQYLFSTTNSHVFHTYAPGSYTVACTATDGTNTATSVLPITVA
jgi:hypothetical protein